MASPSPAAADDNARPTNNVLAPNPIFRLPRELRDKIYEHVLLNAGTLFFGVHPERVIWERSSEVWPETTATIVDIRLQQRFSPLPLLGVSRSVGGEFLEAVMRYGRDKHSICFYAVEEGDCYLSGRGPAEPEKPMKSIRTDTLISCSWVETSSEFLQALFAILKWQTDQAMLVKGLKILRIHSRIEVSWTCYNGSEGVTSELQFGLDMFFDSSNVHLYELWFQPAARTINMSDVRLFVEKQGKELERPLNMFLAEEDSYGVKHEFHINDASGNTSQCFKTSTHLLLYKMKDQLGKLLGRDEWITSAESMIPTLGDGFQAKWIAEIEARRRKVEDQTSPP